MSYNCCVTGGLELQSCVNILPGISSLYVLTSGTGTTECSLDTISYSGTGEVIGFTGTTSGLEVAKIDLVRNSAAALTEAVSVTVPSLGFVYQTQLIFTMPSIQQSHTNLYQEIVQNTASVFIVELKSGKYFLATPSGMYLESATIASGSVPGDDQLYNLTLTSQEQKSVPQIAVNTTLTAWLAANTNITLDRE